MYADKSYDENLEKELLHKVASGNQKSFTELFERYQTLVYDYALRLTRSKSQAEEIVQDIFIKIWVNRRDMENIQNFGGYINRMARNQSYTALRKIAAESLRMAKLTQPELVGSNSSEHRILYNESTKILKAAVDVLPPQRKLVYELCHEQGLKYDEVAAKLNISPGTVHTHMKLALKSIRTYFHYMDATIIIFIFFIKR
ncbi:RNA polymerase sigma factor [Pedobacter hartonius]|uniref:RNA polymerase sigma-70 factor, ECF subfamily n=1 Tax=Pedobacter hartonius TaxID=425514 RepID=A0A1H3WTN0_9SPHI|nr:RNA polymerase sigma-70 factor [Pedobacter hartonius]SDZ90483.1 RNA polymerase sigma-70 factor, ECF subfamily [Pedobacter hartonius]